MSKMTSDNARKILGVDFKATIEECKKAYRKLAMKFHPDRQDGDESKFKEVKEAYEHLEKNGNSSNTKYYYPDETAAEHFKDMFKRTYGFDSEYEYGAFNERKQQYRVLQEQISIDILTAFSGTTHRHTVQLGGSTYNYIVNIPAGIRDGERISDSDVTLVAGGDIKCNISFYVKVKTPGLEVNWDGSYDGSRVGDITTEIYLSPFKMIVGGWERITTLDGKEIDIRIPAGQKTNGKLKVQGKGYWKDTDRNHSRGDLYLTTIPKITKIGDLTEDDKKCLQEILDKIQDKDATSV